MTMLAVWLQFALVWLWIATKPDGWPWAMFGASVFCGLLEIRDLYHAKRAARAEAK